MSTRNLPGGKGRPARKAHNLTAISESIVQKMWEPRHLTTLWAFTACYRDSFPITRKADNTTLNDGKTRKILFLNSKRADAGSALEFVHSMDVGSISTDFEDTFCLRLQDRSRMSQGPCIYGFQSNRPMRRRGGNDGPGQ
jgi:hypothetical protein